MIDTGRPALKDIFDEKRFRLIAKEVTAVWPPFDSGRFLRVGLTDLAQLTLLQRLRNITLALGQTLPPDYPDALAILYKLARDPSLYVRKSVANHLNDVSKDHPEWVLNVLARWPQIHPHPIWIAKRALRTLVKAGHPRALLQVGASDDAAVTAPRFELKPGRLSLGDTLNLSVDLQSQSAEPLRLVVDYRVHYVKKAGGTSAKVFKLKELTLDPHGQASFTRRQRIQDFTTRTHYCGEHLVELLVNGKCVAQSSFELCG